MSHTVPCTSFSFHMFVTPFPEEVYAWGVLWPGGRRLLPLSQRKRHHSWAKWTASLGDLAHCDTQWLHGRFGYAKWINYMAKPSASWFSSSHETRESLKICHYCNKAKKIRHSLFLLFRILWKFQPQLCRTIQSFNTHKDSKAIIQHQKANCQKTREKAEFRLNK